MAGRIDGPWNPALDGNGAPINGSLLEFYANGTDTPLSAYPSAADADAGTNGFTSQTANSAGRFEEAFGPDDTRYRIKWKTAAGAQIDVYEPVQVQGGTEGITYLDLDANGRFRVFGADGKVQVETGDPVGDDAGGSARFGGWDSTQGDDLELDYALTTATGDLEVNGDITEAGKPMGLIRLLGGNFSAVTSLDIDLPAGYEHFILELTGVIVGTAAVDLKMRGSWSAGVFATTSYENAGELINGAGGTSSILSSMVDGIALASDVAVGSDRKDITVRIGARSLTSRVDALYSLDNGGASTRGYLNSGGRYTANTGMAIAIRLLASSGTITATYTLYGLKGLAQGQAS